MASNLEYVEYVCDQLSGAGVISYKKMFGDYCVYCDGKVFGLICDDQLFIKKTAAGLAVIPDCELAAPYEGAKPHLLIENVDDRELMAKFISATCDELPMPKPKKKKLKD